MINRRLMLTGAAAATLAAGPVLAGDHGAALDAVAAEFSFNGVILLARQGQPTLRRAYGLADAEAVRPAAPGDRYVIASVSKWLTVAAIFRLVEQGRLDLDVRLGEAIPGYAAAPGARVTLRQLLNNTSGIPNLFGPALKADPDIVRQELTTAQAVQRYCSADLAFEPGAKFDYSVTNWILVAAVIEAAMPGQSFARVVDEQVVTPLGLRDTAVAAADFAGRPDTAVAYASLAPPVRKMSERPAYTAAAGGFCSTVSDLHRAADGVFHSGFLSKASLDQMLTVTVPEQHYALGGRVARLATPAGERIAAWETGRTDGYRSVLAHVVQDRTTVALLNNTDLSQQTMDQIALRLLSSKWA